MQTRTPYRITQGLLRSLLALWIWFIFSSAVFALVTGGYGWAAFEISVGIVLVYVLAKKELHSRAEQRPIPFLAVGAMAVFALAIGLMKVADLLDTRIFQVSGIRIPEAISAVSALGFLILLVVFGWQLILSLGSRKTR